MNEPPTTGPGEPESSPPQTTAAEPESPWLPGVWSRLKHHKVMQWTLAYAAAAYTLLHGVEMLSDAQEWPHIFVRIFSLVLILGVPIVATLAWYHGARGLKSISGGELMIITLLGIIAGSVLWALARSGGEHTPAVTAVTTVAAPAAPRTAVAVLPFANLTGDASKEYLGDGMAEELINTLTKVHGLKVPARTSTFAYKGRNTDIRQIAKDLGVGTILEGSVRAAGKRLRITAQLINAQDGLHLWSETYDEEFTDLFKLQDKLATAIATALQPNLLSAIEAAVAQGPPTQDVEAYNLYLQGVSLGQRPSEPNVAKAIDYFQQALARDPKFARAYALIAQTQLVWSYMSHPAERFAASERAARQALALDPNLALGHIALAGINAARIQYLEMEVHRRAAVSLAPNDGVIRAISAAMLPAVGHFKQAIDEAVRAYALAPANPSVVALLANQLAQAGHDLESAKYADAAVDLGYPKETFVLTVTRERIALHAGRYADAAAIATSDLDVRNPDQARIAEVARLAYGALASPGRQNASLAAGASHTSVDLCGRSSYYYALMAANDIAYGILNECLDRRAPDEGAAAMAGSAIFTLFNPELRAFRRDPRFQALDNRLGLMEYWRQYGPPDDCDLKDGKLTCH